MHIFRVTPARGFPQISINFLHASRARRGRKYLKVYPPARTLELLAYYEAFDDPRFIPRKKAEISKRQYSSKDKSSNVHDFGLSSVQYHGRGVHSCSTLM
jgi:hypothetical protein